MIGVGDGIGCVVVEVFVREGVLVVIVEFNEELGI